MPEREGLARRAELVRRAGAVIIFTLPAIPVSRRSITTSTLFRVPQQPLHSCPDLPLHPRNVPLSLPDLQNVPRQGIHAAAHRGGLDDPDLLLRREGDAG